MRIQGAEEAPSFLLALQLIKFHPQRKRAEIAITDVIPEAVAAAQAASIEIADEEATAALAERVRAGPLEIERGQLTSALVVRQNKTRKHGCRTEVRQVVFRQAVVLARFGHERLLLVHGLRLRVVQPGDPEDDARLGRFVVLELPVLQVTEVVVDLACLGGVLEGEALANPPRDRPGVAVLDGELVPFGRGLLEVCRNFFVVQVDEMLGLGRGGIVVTRTQQTTKYSKNENQADDHDE